MKKEKSPHPASPERGGDSPPSEGLGEASYSV